MGSDAFHAAATVAILAGNPGARKSTYGFPVALAAVTDRNDICGFSVKERTRVLIFNEEEELDELERRLWAMQQHNVSWGDLEDENGELMLFLDSGVEDDDADDKALVLATQQLNRRLKANKAEIDAMVETIRKRKIGLVIFDPLSEFHEGNENDNTDMKIATGAMRKIAKRADCAVLAFAHTAKPAKASSKNFAGQSGAIRGASSQEGLARVVGTVFSGTDDDKKKWAFPPGVSPSAYTRVDIYKINGGPEQTVWFKKGLKPVGEELIPTLQHVHIEPKGKIEGEVDSLASFARAMADAGQVNQPIPMTDIIGKVPDLSEEDKADLADRTSASAGSTEDSE